MGIGAFFTKDREGAVGDLDSDSFHDHDHSIYESMDEAEINEELRKAGIDPRPTIDAVKQLVRQKLIQSRRETS